MPPLTLNLTKMKQLKDTRLFVIPVPMDAYGLEMRRNNEIVYLLKDVINPLSGTEKSEIIDIPNTKYGFVIKDWELIGTCTADHIDFDPEPYMENWNIPKVGKVYRDYTGGHEFLTKPSQSCRSLLTANDVHFVNPYGEKPAHPIQDSIMEERLHYRYKQRLKEWQQAESKLVEKILILKPL